MTDQELLSLLQYQLVEPVDGGASWPSGLWTRDEVLAAFNARQASLLKATHMQAIRVEQAVLANATSVALPADWIATLHLVWRTAGGVRSPLSPTDAFEVDLLLPTWESTVGTPLVYLDGDQAALTLRLAPVPAANGTLELLYIARATEATGNGVTLSIPDEFLDPIRYGTLSDLLSKVGRAADAGRAQYAQQRYQLGTVLIELLLEGGA